MVANAIPEARLDLGSGALRVFPSFVRSISGRSHRAARAGLTLIELLIVMVVVAILAAITVPSMRNYATASHESSLKETARDIGSGLEADFLRTKGYPATANSFATAHAETPRIIVSGVTWGVFGTTADGSGATVIVRSLSDSTVSCSLGVGSLASKGLTCTP